MKSLQLFRTSSGKFNPVQINPQKPSSSSPRPSSSFSLCNVRRSLSESDMSLVRSELKTTGKFGSRSFSVQKIPEEYCRGERAEEFALSGGGINKQGSGGNGNYGGGNNNHNHHHHHGFYEMGDYYREMIEMDPMNPLLLGNYAKYLYKVKKDFVKAEEYYCRAILASPGDGEMLSLYGKLIWETQRDQNRASFYFEQAIQASPKDCTVLGSYANFLWEAEDGNDDDDDDEETEKEDDNAVMVEVF